MTNYFMNWTLDQYRRICIELKNSGYVTKTIQAFYEHPVSNCVLLRHDIDRFPDNALAMARLEHELKCVGSYYVRFNQHTLDSEIIKEIASLGHEIGYHYETLSKCGGDRRRALHLFGEELSKLREIVPIKTATAHGRPFSRWNNQSLLTRSDVDIFELSCEAYLDINYSNIAYITDTGRCWNAASTNFRDKVESNIDISFIVTTQKLLEAIAAKNFSTLCLQIHPERWSYSFLSHCRSQVLDFTANSFKRLIRKTRTRM